MRRPMWLSILQIAPNEFFIDDGLRRRHRIVETREICSGAKWDAHCFEIARTHCVGQSLILSRVGPCQTLNRESSERHAVNIKRHGGGDGR